MTKQIINIGSGPNTRDGDTVRLAFDKVNQNFDELYGYIGSGYTGGQVGNGYTGSQGEPGSQGSIGETGFTGSQGDIGDTGSQGEFGYTGSQGIQGEIGAQGDPGINGEPGAQGFTGSSGDFGFTGSHGYVGSHGFTGSAGTNGYTGSAGTNGYFGSHGFTGSAGTNGFTGSAGTNGYTGSAGTNGYNGSAGTNGYTGSAGLHGYTGSQGSTGTIGATGFTGSQGLTGATGYTGSQGSNGSAGYTGSIGFTGSVGYAGSQGLSGNNLSNQTIILNNVAPAIFYNGSDVTQWSAAFTGQGGQLLIRADITAYTTSSTARNWYLKKNGTTVATGQFFFNATSTHMTLPTLQYIDSSGSTSAATWSISLGSGLVVDAQDRATITVTEYTGLSGLTVSGLINSSYLLAQNSADQNSVGNGTAIAFQTTLASNGTMITKGSNTQTTLTGGQTYRLEAIIKRFSSSATWGTFKWYDVTNSTYVGAEAFGETANSGAAVGSTSIATTIVSPNANTTYELRQTSGNTISVTALYATIEITQINPSVSLGTINAIAASGDLSGRYLISTNATGDEGGEIQLAKPPNATISGGVTIDAYQNRIRIFEQGGTARGVYLDLTKTAPGVGSELVTKVSGYVNAGTFVTLDNIKATVTTSGSRGLSLATVSGSITYTIGANFGYVNGAGGGSSNGNATLTTTPTGSFFGWSFPDAGAMSIYIITDLTNSKTYRITLQIGGGYLNNFICIERL